MKMKISMAKENVERRRGTASVPTRLVSWLPIKVDARFDDLHVNSGKAWIDALPLLQPEIDVAKYVRDELLLDLLQLNDQERRHIDEEDGEQQTDEEIEPERDDLFRQSRLALDHGHNGVEEIGRDDRPNERRQGMGCQEEDDQR